MAWSYEQVNLSKPSEFAESTQVYYSSLSASRRMSASWTLRGHQTCAVGCSDTGSTVLSNGDNKERIQSNSSFFFMASITLMPTIILNYSSKNYLLLQNYHLLLILSTH